MDTTFPLNNWLILIIDSLVGSLVILGGIGIRESKKNLSTIFSVPPHVAVHSWLDQQWVRPVGQLIKHVK